MKLRNKKTGIVGELHYEPDKEYHFTVATEDPADMAIYRSLTELNEDWEDYVPTEPIIKDEKIRKAVRAWAEGSNFQSVHYDAFWTCFRRGDSSITVWEELPLEDNKAYTIDELCGEEEE